MEFRFRFDAPGVHLSRVAVGAFKTTLYPIPPFLKGSYGVPVVSQKWKRCSKTGHIPVKVGAHSLSYPIGKCYEIQSKSLHLLSNTQKSERALASP
jgi:hypothetical protein